MSTRLEYWTVDSPTIKRRGRTSVSSRNQLVYDGSYIPSTTTAGILTVEADLTAYSGSYIISTPGTLIENKILTNYLQIRAANVTVRNCLLKGGTPPSSGNTGIILATHGACANLLVEDCTLSPTTASPFVDGIRGHDYTLRRSIVENCVDGAAVFNEAAPNTNSNVVIEGSWIKDLSFFWGTQGVVHPSDNMTHNDCIQIHGGYGTIIRGNRLDCYYSRTVGHAVAPFASIPPADSGSGGTLPDRGTGTEATGRYNWGSLIAVQYNAVIGATRDIQVLDNYIRGASIPVNVSITATGGVSAGNILRNKFSRDQGQQASGGNATYTVNIKTGTTCTAGEGTSNRNTYEDTGAEVTVRRNG